MKILSQTDSRLVLTGIPGRRVWMIVCCGLGLFLTVAVGYLANLLYEDRGGPTLPHLPLAIGLLIAQGLFWTGVVTLAVGRLTLILDTTLGTGEYRVRSPLVEAGKPCRFKLEQIDSIVIETSRETRPRREGYVDEDAMVHRLRLRLTLGKSSSRKTQAKRLPNKSVDTNRRPAFPFNARRQFKSASCAPPSLSAAVALT